MHAETITGTGIISRRCLPHFGAEISASHIVGARDHRLECASWRLHIAPCDVATRENCWLRVGRESRAFSSGSFNFFSLDLSPRVVVVPACGSNNTELHAAFIYRSIHGVINNALISRSYRRLTISIAVRRVSDVCYL